MKKTLEEIWDSVPTKTRYFIFYLLGLLTLCPIWLASCTGVMSIIKKTPVSSASEEVIIDITNREECK